MSDNVRWLADMHCLVLEDEFLIALDLQQILEAAGAASVTCLADADSALRALSDGAKFDVAVLDVHLGGASRTSFLVAAALTARQTPFMFLTGMRRDTPVASGYAQVPVLEKPYQQAVVLDAIRSLLVAK